MNAWVWKRCSFNAAHTLPLHEGKCKNLHGHTYYVELGILREIDPTTGIAIDMGELSEFLQVNVVACFDHTSLNARLHGVQPTAENIARDILRSAVNNFLLCSIKVRVFETLDSWVEVESV